MKYIAPNNDMNKLLDAEVTFSCQNPEILV